jgi:hypothetical protein
MTRIWHKCRRFDNKRGRGSDNSYGVAAAEALHSLGAPDLGNDFFVCNILQEAIDRVEAVVLSGVFDNGGNDR